jgi:hypothetical protein
VSVGKDREPTAREIRAQLIRKHQEKEALEKEQKQSLTILPAPPTNTEPIKEPAKEESLADDATDNTPGNSDQEDVTVHEDEPPVAEPQLPSSPISILSANTNPALIHPPRALVKVEDGADGETASSQAPNCGLLCGCI